MLNSLFHTMFGFFWFAVSLVVVILVSVFFTVAAIVSKIADGVDRFAVGRYHV
jgi:hypothetical protein